MAIQQEISADLNEDMVDRELRVLVDRLEGDYFVARSEYDSPDVDNEILIQAEYLKIGEFCRVKITGASDYDLFAEPLEG